MIGIIRCKSQLRTRLIFPKISWKVSLFIRILFNIDRKVMVNMCPKFEGCIILSNITKNRYLNYISKTIFSSHIYFINLFISSSL